MSASALRDKALPPASRKYVVSTASCDAFAASVLYLHRFALMIVSGRSIGFGARGYLADAQLFWKLRNC